MSYITIKKLHSGSQTRNISTNRELVKNANSKAHQSPQAETRVYGSAMYFNKPSK